MALAARTRFKGKEEDVLNYIRTWGIFQGCTHYHIGYIALKKWVKEQTGDDTFGLSPAIDPLPDQISVDLQPHSPAPTSWADQLVEAFTHKVVALETEIHQRDQMISLLQARLDYYQHQEKESLEPKVVRLFSLCKTARVTAGG